MGYKFGVAEDGQADQPVTRWLVVVSRRSSQERRDWTTTSNGYPPLCETSRISLENASGLVWSRLFCFRVCPADWLAANINPFPGCRCCCIQRRPEFVLRQPQCHHQNVRIQSADANMPINQPVAATGARESSFTGTLRWTHLCWAFGRQMMLLLMSNTLHMG